MGRKRLILPKRCRARIQSYCARLAMGDSIAGREGTLVGEGVLIRGNPQKPLLTYGYQVGEGEVTSSARKIGGERGDILKKEVLFSMNI